MHGLLRCNINAGFHARRQSRHVTQKYHNSLRWETGLASANDVTHWKCTENFGNLKKVSRVETRHRTRRVDFRLLVEALGRCRTWWGQNRKIVPLSPYVEKPLNSKVIKSFVPELRSCKCFLCFEIPMFYVYMSWTSHVHFAYSCIWLWYNCTLDSFCFLHCCNKYLLSNVILFKSLRNHHSSILNLNT